MTNVTLTCTTATRMWAARHYWKITRKSPQVIRSTSRTITRTRRIERCVRNVQFRHFLIEVLRKEVDLGLLVQKQREHTVNHGREKTIFRGLMLSTFMPSEPSEPPLSAHADVIVKAVFENCRCHHWSPTCALTRAINSRITMYVDGHEALFLCRETATTIGRVQGSSGTITENGFVF